MAQERKVCHDQGRPVFVAPPRGEPVTRQSGAIRGRSGTVGLSGTVRLSGAIRRPSGGIDAKGERR